MRRKPALPDRDSLILGDFESNAMTADVVAKNLMIEVREALESSLRSERPWMAFLERYEDEGNIARMQVVRKAAMSLLRHDALSWRKRIAELETPDDFDRFFAMVGVDSATWRSSAKMQAMREPFSTAGLQALLRERFGSHPLFVAWMTGRENEEPVNKRVERCETQRDYLELFESLGIPGDKWKESSWMETTSGLPAPEGVGKRLGHVATYIREKPGFESYHAFVAWMTGTTYEKPVRTRLTACATPAEARALIGELGIPGDNWKNGGWMRNMSKLPVEEGGMGRNMSGLVTAAETDERFMSYPGFVAWVEGKTYTKKIPTAPGLLAACATPGDVLTWFATTGIPGDKWKSTDWMQKGSVSPPPDGVGESQKDILNAVTKDARFGGSYPRFVAWVESAPADDDAIKQAFMACGTRADIERLFTEQGLDGRWASTHWLRSIRREKTTPETQRTWLSLFDAIIARFGNYAPFVEWMEIGKKSDDQTYVDRVRACETPDDFLAYFGSLNVPEGKWKGSRWFSVHAQKSTEQGGIGRSLSGLVGAIIKDPRFGTYKKFLLWMNAGSDSLLPLTDRLRACEKPEDCLRLFASLGIPGDKWKNIVWLTTKAHLPAPEGVGIKLSGVPGAIKLDKRFVSFRKFVAWMEGRTEVRKSMPARIKGCVTREQFREFFAALGIDESTWRQSGLMDGREREGLPGHLTRVSIAMSIRSDARFRSYPRFVAWMDGYEGIDPNVSAKVAACATQEDFDALFDELGIPVRQRKNLHWLVNASAKPKPEGGIGKSMRDVAFAIIEDRRFKSFRRYLSWREGNPGNVPEKVSACATPGEMLALLREFGVQDDRWRLYGWMSSQSGLPHSHGGVGRSLRKFVRAVLSDVRFGADYKTFVLWMDGGTEALAIDDDDTANRLLTEEARRLGVSVNDILQPEALEEFRRTSPVIRAVMRYAESKRSPKPA